MTNPGTPTTSDGISPWAQPLASRWRHATEAKVIADMAGIEPAQAATVGGGAGRWRLIEYEADDIAGRMIWASVGAQAPPVRVPLGVTGWHAVFIGLYATVLTPSQAFVRVGGRGPERLFASRPTGEDYWSIEDVFVGAFELASDDAMRIAQPTAGHASACGVAYVRLVPLSEDEIAALQADRARRDTRTMAATSDGYSYLWSHRPTTREELLPEIERFRDTDYGTLLLHLGGADLANFPTRAGTLIGAGVTDFAEPGQRYAAESVRILAENGVNPTTTWIDAAHDIGMKVHIGVRPALWTYYEPHAAFFTSRFYRDHPEWRCVDRDGRQAARMSFAVPQVREHLIGVLREGVALGADGAHIVFNRGFPMVLYEEPFVELFRAEHGIDPRGLPESDPRITRAWSDLVTRFMRGVRDMLDDETRRRGGGDRLALSACVLGTRGDNLRYGVDIERLLAEGLLDEVYVYCYDFGQSERRVDGAWFRAICRPRGARFVPMFSGPYIQDERIVENAREALAYYDAGADGVAVWDPPHAPAAACLAASRMGRRDELAATILLGGAASHRPRVRHVGGVTLDGRFPPYWGG